jgi:segregation and condensation protein A
MDENLGNIEEFVELDPQTPQDSESSIRDHLLFHKAIISDDEDNNKLDEYVSIVEQLEDGMTIAFPDPFDRAIAITFELSIKHNFDPWNVDLEKFSDEYLKHVKKNNDLDLVTAGRIILMAWKILKLQSDQVLIDAQTVQKQEEEELWHEPDGDWFTNDEDFEFTTTVINSPTPPVQEMIWHKGTRRVSLLELVGALEEAKRESEIMKILSERRAEERDRNKQIRRQTINNKLHKEDLQEEIEMIYARISKFNGLPIPLSDIYTSELEDKITTLVSSLFLAHHRKINIWQRKFPYGQIFVKNLNNLDIVDNEGIEDNVVKGGNSGNGGNGGNGDNDDNDNSKILLRDLELGKVDKLEKMDKKKKKKIKEELEELITSHNKVAS